jgi:hypothetical protein
MAGEGHGMILLHVQTPIPDESCGFGGPEVPEPPMPLPV